MEKEFIPYDLSLKLKELGFNEPCFGLYAPPSKTVFLHHYGLLSAKEQILAPLYQQAFKWIMQFPPLNKWACNIAVYSDGTYSIKDGKYAVHEYLSSEECLKKLIEIVEQKEK